MAIGSAGPQRSAQQSIVRDSDDDEKACLPTRHNAKTDESAVVTISRRRDAYRGWPTASKGNHLENAIHFCTLVSKKSRKQSQTRTVKTRCKRVQMSFRKV